MSIPLKFIHKLNTTLLKTQERFFSVEIYKFSPKIHTERQRIWSSQNNLEKRKITWGGINLPNVKNCYIATVIEAM